MRKARAGLFFSDRGMQPQVAAERNQPAVASIKHKETGAHREKRPDRLRILNR